MRTFIINDIYTILAQSVNTAYAQLQIAFVDNERGKQSPAYQNLFFQVKNRRDDRIYWRCATKTHPSIIGTLTTYTLDSI
jgi:hypothetical protein